MGCVVLSAPDVAFLVLGLAVVRVLLAARRERTLKCAPYSKGESRARSNKIAACETPPARRQCTQPRSCAIRSKLRDERSDSRGSEENSCRVRCPVRANSPSSQLSLALFHFIRRCSPPTKRRRSSFCSN